MNYKLPITALFTIASIAANASIIAQWTFDDTAGTDLGAAVDSENNVTFSANLGGGGTWATNGSGTLSGLGRIGNADVADFSTGIYQLDLTGVTMSSMSGGTDDVVFFGFRSFSAGNNTGFGGDGSSSANQAVIVFGNENNSGGLDMEVIDNNAIVGTVTDAAGTTGFTGTYDFRIVLDMDNDTANYQWQRNGGGFSSIVSQQFNGAATITHLAIGSNGFDATISIDTITLTAVPEPSTYALLAGMLTLGLVLVRRRQR